MVIARNFPSVATPSPVHSETQAPATSALLPEAQSFRSTAPFGLPAGLTRRQVPVHGGDPSPRAPRAGLDRLSRAAQTGQPAKTAGTSVGCTDIFNRLKEKFGRHACSPPSDKSLFESSLQYGLVQATGLKTAFGSDKIGSGGVCAGLSTIWMNLHCAAPDGSVNTRLSAVGSFEGMQHALIFQKAYHMNHEHLRRGSGFGRSLETKARADLDGLYGITRDMRPIKSTSSAAKIAATMASIDGYASLIFYRTDKAWKTTGHEMGLHRNPEDGMITFFDPNHGEFRFKSEDAAQFLRTLREKYRLKSDVSFDWALTNVRPNNTGSSTPLDFLVDYVKADQERLSRS
ncbi:cysteine protease domain protein, YopT-type [Paracidovorax avenae ATCC 19860]|uniref:Cysteine protease domain protein, YopT-type n=1 Tax=Paracidovorax avenae (strain ATCC 19860 / DSM 7227 / CCUG 15838 / JCM 20985 / LMG 2117 / NCPPB 1011) TaxID=643561 RepID=F0QA65_PARA1|nr:YopT-type cysteine protease domain-containing protein [Paracidovorax avenae]ADX48433.1 cysteine protease domain protein, YopT-type [Paracidovorax avenae ATCC 19860]AVS65515.1 YopT-type cysteine protease domain-containing protein [Paracidovorax avenae]